MELTLETQIGIALGFLFSGLVAMLAGLWLGTLFSFNKALDIYNREYEALRDELENLRRKANECQERLELEGTRLKTELVAECDVKK